MQPCDGLRAAFLQNLDIGILTLFGMHQVDSAIADLEVALKDGITNSESSIDDARRLFAPVLRMHGYTENDCSRLLDNLTLALRTTGHVLARCSDTARRAESDTIACLIAASVRAQGRIDSKRLHELLSLSETVARVLQFTQEEQRTQAEATL